MEFILLFSILFGDVFLEITGFECMLFDVKHGYKMSGVFQSSEGLSQLTCAFQCFEEPRCKAASFYESGKICEFAELHIDNDVTAPDDGWQVIEKQVCYDVPPTDDEIFEVTACGKELVHECRHGYVSPGFGVTNEILSCDDLALGNVQPKTCVQGTCRDILLDRPDAGSGVYVYKDPDGNDVTIYCDFYGSYGYTFFSSASLANLSSPDPHLTTSSEAVIRHFRSDGSQTEATMKIITRYRDQYNLTFLLNEEFDNDGSLPDYTHTHTDEPYLTLGFVPLSFGNKLGTIQGYNVNGNDIEFTNIDTNPASSIKFYLTPLNHESSFYCCDYNSVRSAWYDYANTHAVEPTRYLPSDFAFRYMMMMGGGGAFWTYEHFEMGVALGLKFTV